MKELTHAHVAAATHTSSAAPLVKSDDGAALNRGAPPQVGGVRNKCDRSTNVYPC